MFSALKRNLKFRITHLLYNIAITRYEAQSWTRTTLCQNCQKLISIDAHFCMYCGGCIIAPAATSEETRRTEEFSPMDSTFHVLDSQLQDTEPISLDDLNALLSSQYTTTRRFLEYARSYNGQHISSLAIQHRQRQDQELI